MNIRALVAVAVFTTALSGCMTAPVLKFADVPVSAGMSREDLRKYFGAPQRIDATNDGGETWYYLFGSEKFTSEHVSQSTGSENPGNTSASWSKTQTTKIYGQPVYISKEGHVKSPVPEGKIILRQ